MAGPESDCFIVLVPNVSEKELREREREAAERAVIFNAEIRVKMEEGKLPEVVKVE